MCGRRSRAGYCLLAWLLCGLSALSWGDAPKYPGPPLPAGWYPIHESELIALETTLSEQESSLEAALNSAQQWQDTSQTLERTIEQLRTSYATSAQEAGARIRRQQIEIWADRGIIVGLIALTLWALAQ